MDHEPVRTPAGGLTLAASLAAGLAGLALLTQTVQNSGLFERWHATVLAANAVGALALLVGLAFKVKRLMRASRLQVPGATLTLRMVGAFAAVAAGPVLIVFLVAVQFLHRGIETWADDRIASGLEQSLQLSRAALDAELRTRLVQTQAMAGRLGGQPAGALFAAVSELRREAGARELTVFGRNYRILATSTEAAFGRLPELPTEDVMLQLPRVGHYVGLEPAGEDRLRVRVAVTYVAALEAQGDLRILQALYPVDATLGALAESVQGTYTRYGELAFLREPLETSFTVALLVAVLLALAIALYGAFVSARRLVAPVRRLVAGTHAVAAGQLDTRLAGAGTDDLGLLVASFNDMTAQLQAASVAAARSAAETERSRASLATVLARLTSGVVAVDSGGCLRIANAAAAGILQAELAADTGLALAEVGRRHPALVGFLESCAARMIDTPAGWREQMPFTPEHGGRRVLMCSASPLPDEQGAASGYVLVFDDITGLLQAQREAAWGEVARRLAHEIKNPLTPIRLSAERIRRRYLASLPGTESELLDRATHTIVQQVEAMRDMVDAFSAYARSPEVRFGALDLNTLVREVTELYHGPQQPVLVLELEPDLGHIEADAVRLRQLIHNLLRNAGEALEGVVQARVTVCTRRAGTDRVEITVTDNGPGIDPDLLERIFDPYVTTKVRGTGLGLAIVRRLVEEHGGTVAADNLAGGGAVIRVTLPVSQRHREAPAEARPRRAGERR
ncbi:MAG: HAMP domain-containing protein [Gammaproteobacteria bacterium]|nr:HAMP domain-containing protein [Gammaproteobacteria bacterium]